MLTVQDPLYGAIELPEYLLPFLLSPEFRRLGGVRLLNFESLELAALSEVRRRSHTLGVLHLATRVSLLDFGPDEVKALLFAIVMHDIGTPPFGHTLEYEYMRRLGRDHEEAAARILDLTHHPLGENHQFQGHAAELPKLVKATGCEHVIRAILNGSHPLSALVFGDLDLDNIDNVFRMSWYLGQPSNGKEAIRLASAIDVDRSGRKYLSKEQRPYVECWLERRAAVYYTLLNSRRHRQNQAVFSRIVFEAMEQEDGMPLIDDYNWFDTDERMLERLEKVPRLKPFFAELKRAVLMPEVGFEFVTANRISRTELMRHRDELKESLDKIQMHAFYVSLIPYGETLARTVRFIDRATGEEWSVGAPRLCYRLYVHIAGRAAKSMGIHAATLAVRRKIDEHAERAGWKESRGEAEAPRRCLLEL